MKAIALIAACVVAGWACGGSQSNQTSNVAANPPTQQPAEEEHPGGIVIEGQMGFLSPEQLSAVLTPATSQLAACYNDRLAANSYLAGRIELKFRIGVDGAPVWVIP